MMKKTRGIQRFYIQHKGQKTMLILAAVIEINHIHATGLRVQAERSDGTISGIHNSRDKTS